MTKNNIKIVYKAINELKEAEYNPRKISKDQFNHLKESIKNFECVEPIIINTYEGRENIIVGGHQRFRALKALKHTTIPCVEVDLPIEKEKELNIRLNKNTGEFNFDELANNFEVSDLLNWGFTPEEFGIEFEKDEEKTDEPEQKNNIIECPNCQTRFDTKRDNKIVD